MAAAYKQQRIAGAAVFSTQNLDIYGSVQSDSACVYVVDASVFTELSPQFFVNAQVSSNYVQNYDILANNEVTADAVVVYGIAGVVHSDATITYQVRPIAVSDIYISFNINSLVANNFIANYSIAPSEYLVTTDLVCGYSVLTSWPTPEQIAAAILAQAQVTPIHADARAIKGYPLTGTGQVGDEFGV